MADACLRDRKRRDLFAVSPFFARRRTVSGRPRRSYRPGIHPPPIPTRRRPARAPGPCPPSAFQRGPGSPFAEMRLAISVEEMLLQQIIDAKQLRQDVQPRLIGEICPRGVDLHIHRFAPGAQFLKNFMAQCGLAGPVFFPDFGKHRRKRRWAKGNGATGSK